MKKTILGILVLSSNIAFGYSYVCKKEADVRTVQVAYNNDPLVKVPCSTLYMKGTETTPKGTWRSEHDPRFCEQKADYMAKRLEEKFGFKCELTK